MPATARNMTEEHTTAAKGEVVYLPNAQLPEEKLQASHPWDSPTYAVDQQQAQMLMLALNQMDNKEQATTTDLEQAHQTPRPFQQWQATQSQQQQGAQIIMSDEERTAKQASQLAAQRAMMAPAL